MKHTGDNFSKSSSRAKRFLKISGICAVCFAVLIAVVIYSAVLRPGIDDSASDAPTKDSSLSSNLPGTTRMPETQTAAGTTASEKQTQKQTTKPRTTAAVPTTGSTDDLSWIPAEGLMAPAGYTGKTAYLTFDDGPSSSRTPEILDVLVKYGVNATFFLVGQNIRPENYSIIRRAYVEGNAIGNHTYDHFSAGSSLEHFKDSVTQTSDLIEQITGERPDCFRFPGGSNSRYMSSVIKEAGFWLHDNGYEYFDWNTSTGDGYVQGTYSAEQLCGNALKNTFEDHLIVLMHDSSAKAACPHDAVGAVPLLIRALYDRGYKFDVLSRFSTAKQFS